MTLMQIFHIFSKSPSSARIIAYQTDIDEQENHSSELSWPEIDRRAQSDRRQHERRVINYQPYIDTRKNHGRRRSFGRRTGDQIPA